MGITDNTALLRVIEEMTYIVQEPFPSLNWFVSLGIKEFPWDMLLRAPWLWESDKVQEGFSFKAIPLSCGWAKVGLWPQDVV